MTQENKNQELQAPAPPQKGTTGWYKAELEKKNLEIDGLYADIKREQDATKRSQSERDELARRFAMAMEENAALKDQAELMSSGQSPLGIPMGAGPNVEVKLSHDSQGRPTQMSEGRRVFLDKETGKPTMFAYHGIITCRDDSRFSLNTMLGRAQGLVGEAFKRDFIGSLDPRTGECKLENWPSFDPKRELHVMVWIQ